MDTFSNAKETEDIYKFYIRVLSLFALGSKNWAL